MLSACIKSESLKVKRSFIWVAFLLVPLIPTLMGTQNYLNNIDILQSEWSSLWTQETLFYSNFFFAPLVAIYCSYLWRLENRNKNRHLLMTAPVPVRNLFLAKLITVGKITLLTQLWMFVLYLISGKLIQLPGLPPLQIWLFALRGFLAGLVIITLQLFLSMIIHSFAAPIAFAVLGSVTGLLIANSRFGICYPYSLMMLGMNANRTEDMLAGSSLPFLLSVAVWLTFFFTLSVLLLRHRDVKA